MVTNKGDEAMQLSPLTLTFITAIISSLASALVASIVASSKSRIKKEKQTMDALNAGMRALLWRELNDIHKEALTDGGMTPDERHNLEQVYNAYHQIGGNGTGTRIYEEAMKLPVIQS